MIRPSSLVLITTLLVAGGVALQCASAAPPPSLGTEYTRGVRPLLQSYCTGCHSGAKHAGELDLERFATLAAARKDPKAWLKVAEMLDNREMPPKSAKQPTPQQRTALRGWVKRFLDAEALAAAGDPGPVVLRRLNNAEYTYTIRDLTGVDDLNPAREFPTDSAAGEGFTNTGSSLVMSPALLTKYFDAGKEIARHAELLPDGFRFSPHTTRNDWTNDTLAQIRGLYRKYTDSSGASTVNLQGIVFNTNDGGRLPLEPYIAATLELRDAGKLTVNSVAKEHSLSPKYLGLLWTMLHDRAPNPLFEPVRAQWRSAKSSDAPAIAATIRLWQKALWRFTTVGQIGRPGTSKAWQEAVTPLATQQELRVKLPPSADGKEVTVYLTARDAGDGNTGDSALWSRPRIVAPGRPDIPLRDLPDLANRLVAARQRLFSATARALEAATAAQGSDSSLDVAQLASKYQVDAAALSTWLEYLGIRSGEAIKLNHFGVKQVAVSKYEFVNGWGSPDLPSLVANSSNQHVRIPGNMKAHGVCVHPTPQLDACAGWQSPITGFVTIQGQVTHAHPECGNGVTWAVELRRGSTRRRLVGGVAQGGTPRPFGPTAPIAVRPGDLISLVIGPRNHDHSCDLTDLELVLESSGPDAREWSLTRDVSPNVLAGNPHADSYGNSGVWHFYSEPDLDTEPAPAVPAGSVLARWEAAPAGERAQLASAVEKLLTSGAADPKSPDAALYRQLSSLSGPLLLPVWRQLKQGDGDAIRVQAPSVQEVHIPADLAAGAELVTTASLDPQAGAAGSVQMQVLTSRPASATGLIPDAPVITGDKSESRKRFETAFDQFRALFPIALAYTKIVPVDEVITLTLFHREDEPLERLMLTDADKRELDRYWKELEFVSQGPLKLVNAYEQLREFATQDRPDLADPLKSLKQGIYDGAAAFDKAVKAAEPVQVDRLIEFAARAYRSPLTPAESAELRNLYKKLRSEELPHDEAFRLTLARVFVSPAFLYRLEKAPNTTSAPISDWELASRLSYFLWSSLPDEPLRAAAASGTLHKPEVLSAQVKRMLRDPKTRRLATEFGSQWLHIYEFDALDEKSEKYFPEFATLRKDMYEEAIRFLTDAFQHDGSILGLFDSDHTFVNERLAKFYGIPGITGEEWHRVDGLRARGRGGLLGLAATLAKQSGASRTSPILRGTWVSEVLLGEKLPRPPKGVPQLPEDETATAGLTVRQLVAKHTSDPSCAGCHRKIDPYGFALEGFDAIGRFRTVDLAKRPIDAKTRTPDGHDVDGLAGLREYLTTTRRQAVLHQFCRKLLGYALGRSVQLSDEPLLMDIEQQLAKKEYRFSVAVDMIVRSRQFREIRGQEGVRNAAND